jgi:cell division protein FtsB
MVPLAASCTCPHRDARYLWHYDKQGEDTGPLANAHSNSKLTLQLPALAGAAKGHMYLWRRRAATVAVGALALVMAYGVIFGHNGLTAFAHKREEARSLQLQTQQLQKENDRLHEHVDHLQSDPGAIEHQAREELHYTRAGEVIYTTGKPQGSSKP